MKKMTKALSLFLAVLMLALPLAGCGAATSSAPESSETEVSASQPESSLPEESSKLEAEKADINIIGLKGPTALGMLQICLLYTSLFCCKKSGRGKFDNTDRL